MGMRNALYARLGLLPGFHRRACQEICPSLFVQAEPFHTPPVIAVIQLEPVIIFG